MPEPTQPPTETYRLSDFITPIRSGCTPVPESERHRIELTREARAELEERLAELREFRARSMLSARDYVVGVNCRGR
jgi:hypothetical protein